MCAPWARIELRSGAGGWAAEAPVGPRLGSLLPRIQAGVFT